jgi:hypothetical protein
VRSCPAAIASRQTRSGGEVATAQLIARVVVELTAVAMPAGSERDAVAVAAAAAAKRRAAVPYELLRAHGLQPPSLLADVVPQQPPLPTPPPAAERPSPRLVKNAAGRWELQRAPGDDEPPPEPLQRPGAELAAAVRKRKVSTRACGARALLQC